MLDVAHRGPLAARVFASILALTAVSACSTTANVVDLYMGLDAPDSHGETRRRKLFYTDTAEIHCIAQVGVGRPNATLEGYIRQVRAYDFNRNEFFETNRILAYTEENPQPSQEPVYLDMKLERLGPDGEPSDDAPYLAGSYVCELALDGEVQKSAAFNIDLAPCPPAFIVPETPCFGFHPEGNECPKYGERSTDPATCRCTKSGWQCDAG